MITHRIWIQQRKRMDYYGHTKRDTAVREGWFLFWIIPLYIRDRKLERQGTQ